MPIERAHTRRFSFLARPSSRYSRNPAVERGQLPPILHLRGLNHADQSVLTWVSHHLKRNMKNLSLYILAEGAHSR